MAQQGFRSVAGNPFVYQENDAGTSAAMGIKGTDEVWKLVVGATTGSAPTGTAKITVDPAVNAPITLTPDGTGYVKISNLTEGAAVLSSTGEIQSSGAGTAGQILVSQGAGFVPSWQDNVDKTMTGWATWGGAGNYFDDTTLGSFTILRPGTGFIKGQPISWAAPQTVNALAQGNTYLIYIDNTGTIGATTSYDLATFQDYIVLFEVLYDFTPVTANQFTVKENHPYDFQAAVSFNLHETVGAVIENHNNGANITINGTQKIQINGTDTLSDHGLYTDIPDSSGVGVAWYKYYTDGAGKWARQNATDTFGGFYNNAGTPTALGATKFAVYTLYASKDNLTTATPVYIAVLDTSEYNNQTAAQTAIANGTTAIATNELAKLELVRLGYIIYSQASNSIVQVIISKKTVSSSFSTAGANQASLINTNVTNFNNLLSSANTNVQSALDTLDDIFINTAAATTSPQILFKKSRGAAALTSGDLTGTIKFSGYEGTNYIDSARITSTSSGTVALNRVAGDLKFYTHPDSAAADPTLRMTIASTGAVTIAAPDTGTGLTVSGRGMTVTSGDIAISSGCLTLPSTSSTVGYITMNGYRYIHSYANLQNFFAGINAGNLSTTQTVSTGVGFQALSSISSGGGQNTAFGGYCLQNVTSGAYNTAFGACGVSLGTGSYNIYIGGYLGSGSNYTASSVGAATSSNILIQNIGANESNTLRIGTQGSGNAQINRAFIAGIYNTAVGATAGVVLSDSDGQLGGLAGAAGTVLIGGTKPSFSSAIVLATGGSLDTSTSAGNTLLIRAYDVDGTAYKTFATLTANDTPTMDLDTDVTIGTKYIYRADGTDVPVTDGGTGASTLTQNGVLYGNATSAVGATAEGASGTILIGTTGNAPSWLAAGSSGQFLKSNGAASPSWVSTTAVAWSEITAATKTMVVQEGYTANRGSQIEFTLPSTAAVGTELKLAGYGAGLWKILQNANQIIHLGSSATTTGATGYLEATNRYDSISLVCAVADLEWVATSVVGNITVA